MKRYLLVLLAGIIPALLMADVEEMSNGQIVYCKARIIEAVDTDGDGLADVTERLLGTDPENPDTDGDGLSDGDEEIRYNTSALLVDTDGDGYDDKVEIEALTDPCDPLSYPGSDRDGNGLIDDWEMRYFGRIGNDPNGDPDADGLTNQEEAFWGTDPTNPDTDNDGMSDGGEVAVGFSPTEPAPPLTVNIERTSEGYFKLEWESRYSQGYQPLYVDDLRSNVWQRLSLRPLYEYQSYPHGHMSIIDINTNRLQRFYRVDIVPDFERNGE